MEGGSLTDEEIERLGRALMGLEDRVGELREVLGLAETDLTLPIDLSRF
jgi:hypothetical protein